jgi:pimeloyl-ACP methyl ester carboxylesterase
MTATPIWMGPESQPIFGWLHLPHDGRAAGVAVLCPTMGLEDVYAHRTLRTLADKLTESGLAALRFDYVGAGDSAGESDGVGHPGAWLENVGTAVDYARGLGVGRVALVGLRIGGTLAVEELARRRIADDLVLWDPCATGRSFLREQRALWVFLRNQALEWGALDEGDSWGVAISDAGVEGVEGVPDGSVETPGQVFGAQAVEDLESLSIAASQGPLAERILLLTRQGREPDARMCARLAMPHVDTERITGQEALLGVDAAAPEETLERIATWLSKPLGSTVEITPPAIGQAVVGRTDDGRAVMERPVDMGPTHLFGVLTEPEGGAPKGFPTVLFLNAGRMYHQGPGRVWVDLARSWSAHGLRCLRFDLSGIGDSPTRDGRSEQVEYPRDALLDIAEIRQFVSPENPKNVVFVGLCSGGYHAIESALQQPVDTICAVNPVLTFYRRDQPQGRFESEGELALTGRQAWSSVRPWAYALNRLNLTHRVMRRLPDGAWWLANRVFVKAFPARTFKQLDSLNVRLFIIAGSAESTLLRRGERMLLRSLRATGRFRMETVPHLEHSLLEKTGRKRVADLLTEHVLKRYEQLLQ